MLRTTLGRLVAAGFLTLCLVSGVPAWGPITHVVITETTIRPMPGPMIKDPELRHILLATSMGPDFTGLGKAYATWHDPDFAQAIQKVAADLQGRERDRLFAVSYGWMAHIQADSIGHDWTGYPNSTHLFVKLAPDDYLPSHLSTEFSVDLLNYKENQALIDDLPFYMPPAEEFLAAIDAYKKIKMSSAYQAQMEAQRARAKGDDQGAIDAKSRAESELGKADIKLSAEEYQSSIKCFQKTIALELAAFRLILRTRLEIVPQLDERFKERADGIGGIGGINPSVAAVRAGFLSLDQNTPLPAEPTDLELNAATDREATQIDAQRQEALKLDVLTRIAGESSAVRKRVQSAFQTGTASLSPIEAVYVWDLMFGTGLNLDDVIQDAQSFVPDTGDIQAKIADAQQGVDVARRRLDAVEKKARDKSITGRIVDGILGSADAAELTEATQALSTRQQILNRLRQSADSSSDADGVNATSTVLTGVATSPGTTMVGNVTNQSAVYTVATSSTANATVVPMHGVESTQPGVITSGSVDTGQPSYDDLGH